MHLRSRPLTLVLTATLLVAFGCDKKKGSESTKGKSDPAAADKNDKSSTDKVAAHDGKDSSKAHVGDAASNSGATSSNSASAPAKIAFEAPFDGTWEEKHEYRNGLLVEDFVVGTGEGATNGSRLQIHYTGYLLDGTVFDSSVKSGRKPFALTLGEGRVIQGWDKGLVGMKQGGKRRLTIPADLAYGSSQRGKIPANSTLVFTLEMIEVKPPYPAPKSAEVFKGKPLAKQKLEGGKLEIYDYAVGEGEVAQAGDNVAVHYTGTLDNGTVFDSSVPRNSPIDFPLGRGRVIKGWDLGIAGMKVGGQRKLVIAPELGYGDRDMGKIPPKSRLTFTVELMGIDRPPASENPTTSTSTDTTKPGDTKATDAKTTDTKAADTKANEGKAADGKSTDAKPAEKTGDAKKPAAEKTPTVKKPSEKPGEKPVEVKKPPETPTDKPAEKPADKTSTSG